MSPQNKVLYAAFLLLAFAISGCGAKPLAPVSSTPTSTKTPSPSPTATFTSTPSPTTTPSPTPALPVDLSTPLPSGLHTITGDNVANIREIARTGSPLLRGNWFSRDGKLGFVATTGGLLVYDTASNQVIKQIDVVVSPRTSLPDNRLSLSSDGSRISILADGKVEVWDLNKGAIFELTLDNGVLSNPAVRISPNGKLLGVRKEEFTPEGWMAGYKITLYDVDTGQILDNQPSFNGYDFFFSPGGTWFLTRERAGVLWRIADWNRMYDVTIRERQAFQGFSPDDKLAVLQDNNGVLIYEVEGWKLTRQISIEIQDAWYRSIIEFSPDGSKIGISSEDGISVWDIATGEQVNDYPKATSPFILSDDGMVTFQIPEQLYQYLEIASESEDGFFFSNAQMQYDRNSNGLTTARRYAKYSSTEHARFKYQGCIVLFGNTSNCQEFSETIFVNHDGSLYSLRSTDEKNIYNVYREFHENGSSLGHIRSDATYNYPYWISSEEKFLLLSKITMTSPSSAIENTEIWDIVTGKLIKKWTGYITNFTFNPDDNTIAFTLQKVCGRRICGYDLVVYNASTDQILHSETAKTNTEFTALKFAPDGKLIYSIGERQQREGFVKFFVFNPETQDMSEIGLSVNEDDYYYFESMTFSPDGSLLALGLPDGTIRIFDTNTYTEIYAWQAHHGRITYMEFTPDSGLLLSASIDRQRGDGYIRAWGVWP